jgi:hypothetical protein
MRRYFYIAFGLLTLSSVAEAARSVAIPPMRSQTIAGGALGSTTCVSADVPPGVGNSGVLKANQQYTINLRNLSNIVQTVTVIIERESQAETQYGMTAAPELTGPTLKVSSEASYRVVLQPSSGGVGVSSSETVEVSCTKNTCWIAYPGGSIGSAVGKAPNCNQPEAVVCLAVTSRLNVRLEVAEDRGAVSGTISVSAHRECGWKDHYVSPPTFLQINGGRAF